jgi:hypothetical protein
LEAIHEVTLVGHGRAHYVTGSEGSEDGHVPFVLLDVRLVTRATRTLRL